MGSKSSLMLQDEEIRQISEETGFTGQQIEKLYVRFTHLDRSQCGSLSKSDLLSIPELAINPLCDRLIEIFFADSHAPNQRHPAEAERINFRHFVRVLAAVCANSSASSSSSSHNSTTRRKLRSPRAPQDSDSAATSTIHHASQRQTRPDDQHNKRQVAAGVEAQKPSAVSEQLLAKLHFVFRIYDADADGRISFADLRAILKLMVGSYVEHVQLDKIATRAFLEVDRDHDGFIEFSEFCNVFAGKDMDLFRLSI